MAADEGYNGLHGYRPSDRSIGIPRRYAVLRSACTRDPILAIADRPARIPRETLIKIAKRELERCSEPSRCSSRFSQRRKKAEVTVGELRGSTGRKLLARVSYLRMKMIMSFVAAELILIYISRDIPQRSDHGESISSARCNCTCHTTR